MENLIASFIQFSSTFAKFLVLQGKVDTRIYSNPRVTSLNSRVTSSNSRATSSNPRVRESLNQRKLN